tara:strand:- start:308 stop:1549 length:1242 start_codon:yes stop_codon:yes gene_type:complete
MKKKNKKKTIKKEKKSLIKKKPKIKRPKIKRSKIKRPKVKRPKIKRPKIKRPKVKRPKIKRFKKIVNSKPTDRLRKIKLSKFRLKKIKLLKFRIKKKQIYKIKKQAGKIAKISFQNLINFILTPFFKAYDNYYENKKIKRLEKINFEAKEKERRKKEEEKSILETKQLELKNEEKLARERTQDLKKFIKHDQAILRREQAEKRRRFLEEIKLDKKIKSFRKRELEEIKNLEKLALREQREDYRSVEDRLEKIKEKYRLIREQKIRERVESLGVEISDSDTKEDILKKEREYGEHRQKIELVLESFYRSANSLVFQLNKRYIPKHKSILRVIDRRYESNECFVRYDDSPDEDWLILIYLEDSDEKKGKIIVENKTNPEKHETKSFETKEIFTYSDYLVDSMTAHIDRERQKKNN